ncbi:sensor domain-containing diguanylate cyclase [Motilibacter deserti]|uniref:Diguanylate cyclase n=1 Tax=Motilibacter deserti TaxID=2714956 RepID=A0ABX0H323_9ACTN|nr:sensor domain-containing diguanylate cyclase [Motilibacter deserti]NHC16190.1 diguanylate cyclase [Motilibacter deserti]
MSGIGDDVLRALVETAPMAVAVHVDGRFVYANSTAEEILGVGPGAAVGRLLLDHVHPDHVDVVRHRMETLLAGHALPGSVEITMVRAGGELVRVESVSSTVQVAGRTGIYVMACDVTERARREAHFAHLATHDGLTGLPNRLLLLDRLEQALARIGRGCEAVQVLFLDLDGFKQVNDAYGHAAGDELLREVGRRLSATVRAGDTVARLAGDEFVVVTELGGTELPAGRGGDGLRQRLLATITEPFELGRLTASVGVSIGELVIDDPTTASDVLAEADRRMYADKQARSLTGAQL